MIARLFYVGAALAASCSLAAELHEETYASANPARKVLTLLGKAKAVLSGSDDPGNQTSNATDLRAKVVSAKIFTDKVEQLCKNAPSQSAQVCEQRATDGLFCQLIARSRPDMEHDAGCKNGESIALFQIGKTQMHRAPEDQLAKEMTHDLEMNFNKIAPFGKEDTAKELQDHASKTQNTLVDAVENAEVAEIKRAVFRALTRLRAATIKEFDTIARLETQAIDAYNDAHHYRAENPLAHLHEDEAPVETDKLKSFH